MASQLRSFHLVSKRLQNLRPTRMKFTNQGVVFTSGVGTSGQLGETINSRDLFAGVDKLPNDIVQVAAGDTHTVCLSSKGEVYTFGNNRYGALGRHTNHNVAFNPGKVTLIGKVIQVTAGYAHSAALMDDGRVYFWGMFRDLFGAMLEKHETTQSCRTPRLVQIPATVIRLASGGNHMLFLTQTGLVFSAGCPERGQLGRLPMRSAKRSTRYGLSRLVKPDIIHIRGCKYFVDIWATHNGSFLKDRKMGIFVFGSNRYGQLGLRRVERFMVFHPKRSISLSDAVDEWIKIVGGQHHSLLLNSAGKVYTLGRHECGRLGIGENAVDAIEPTLVPGLSHKKIVEIGCGSAVSFAVTGNGEAYGWGYGISGHLGTGNQINIWSPTPIRRNNLRNRRILLIDAGDQHSALLADALHT